MICEMEVISDSSCDSVIISGPIPDYPELKRRKRSSPTRDRRRKDDDDHEDITLDEKVEKIQELEDLVNATASIPIGSEHRGDGDTGNWSGSDTKSLKGGKSRNSAGKYLKKIKTLQQNKRRQETRIARLTKEVRSLRDKNSVQAAYIDVLCGMLGEDMKEKFRDRQGLGILGNVKVEDEDQIGGDEGNDAWCHDDGESGVRNVREDSEILAKEKEFYCVEELDNRPSTSCSGIARSGSIEKLDGMDAAERSDHDGHGVAADTEVVNEHENGDINPKDDEKDGVAEGTGDEHIEGIVGNMPAVQENDILTEKVLRDESPSNEKVPEVRYTEAEVTCQQYDAIPMTKTVNDEFIPIAVCDFEEDSVPTSKNGDRQYDSVTVPKEDCNEYAAVPQTGIHDEVFSSSEAHRQNVLDCKVPDSRSCFFHQTESENRSLHVTDMSEPVTDHLNIQELLDSGDHFLNFKDTAETEASLIQVAHNMDCKVTDGGFNGRTEHVSPTTEDVEHQ